MVGLTDFFMTSGLISMLLFVFFPIILKILVNNKIEKRYNCKLNVEIENRKIFPLYSYFKYCNPGTTIAMAYIFNSKKMIEKNPCLKNINYNINTAPKIEILVCVICWIIIGLVIVFSTLCCIFTQVLNVKP